MPAYLQELRELWSAPLSGFFRGSDDAPPRCYRIDTEGSGAPSLHVQLEDDLFVLDESQLVGQTRLRVLPARPADDSTVPVRYEAEGSRVRRLVGGELAWEHELARRRFGLGLGRDDSDDLEWGREFLGIYREPCRVVALELLDLDGDGRDELIVLSSHGRLEVLSEEGRVLWRRRLVKGSIKRRPLISLVAGESERSLLVSGTWFQVRKRCFWYELHEPFSFLLSGSKLRSKEHGLLLISQVAGQVSTFLDDKLRLVRVSTRHLPKATAVDWSNVLLRGRSNHLTVATDPWSDRGLLLRADPARQRLSVSTLEGEELWEHDLPPTEASSYDLRATLGPQASRPGDELLAIWFNTDRSLAEVRAAVHQPHLWVLRMDGKRLAGTDFPPSGESTSEPVLVLDQPGTNGERRLYAIERNTVKAYAFTAELREELVAPADALAYARNPEFPLPDEDLWSADWLGRARNGGAGDTR